MEENKSINQSRVRMNLTTNAKGFAQMDITVEYPSVVEAKEALENAVKAFREVLLSSDIQEAGK